MLDEVVGVLCNDVTLIEGLGGDKIPDDRRDHTNDLVEVMNLEIDLSRDCLFLCLLYRGVYK